MNALQLHMEFGDLAKGRFDKPRKAFIAKRLAESISHSRLRVIKGASHAPFISHQDQFVQAIQEFLA